MIKDKLKQLHIDEILFCLSIFAKQFYIFKNGSIQFGDILFLISFLCFAVRLNKKIIVYIKKNYLFVVFCLCTIVINVAYFIHYKTEFLDSSLYLVFNLFVIIAFSCYLEEDNNDLFLDVFKNTLYICIITQLSIFLVGQGKWFGNEGRYLGTYNDPNQFAVSIMCWCLLIFIISKTQNKKCYLVMLIGLFLIILSASVGVLLGATVFIIVYLLNKYNNRNFRVVILLICMLGVIVYVGIKVQFISLPTSLEKIIIVNRIFTKIKKLSFISFMDERAWDYIYKYPSYLLYGAGEGVFIRFGDYNEIHNTTLAPMFYYGIIPYALLVKWVYKNLKNINSYYWCVYLCIFFESSVLVNYRQPLFWILILIASYPLVKNQSALSEEKEHINES